MLSTFSVLPFFELDHFNYHFRIPGEILSEILVQPFLGVPRVDFATGGLLQNSPIEKPPFWEPQNMKISPAKNQKSVNKKLGQSPSRD